MEILSKVFLAMDQDCDGVISPLDFKTSFELFYRIQDDQFAEDAAMEWETPEEAQQAKRKIFEAKKSSTYLELLFSKCDLDNDGVIDWHDFLLTACDKAKLFTEFNLREAFTSIDFYQKNYISFDDLQRLYDDEYRCSLLTGTSLTPSHKDEPVLPIPEDEQSFVSP